MPTDAPKHPDNVHGNKPVDQEPQVVFHPINLNDDESEDENDVNNHKRVLPKNATIPTLEDAIQDCFLLAVNSHDAEDVSKAVWDWQVQCGATTQPVPKVDPKTEEDALKSWIPRPLFLPTWAVNFSSNEDS